MLDHICRSIGGVCGTRVANGGYDKNRSESDISGRKHCRADATAIDGGDVGRDAEARVTNLPERGGDSFNSQHTWPVHAKSVEMRRGVREPSRNVAIGAVH